MPIDYVRYYPEPPIAVKFVKESAHMDGQPEGVYLRFKVEWEEGRGAPCWATLRGDDLDAVEIEIYDGEDDEPILRGIFDELVQNHRSELDELRGASVFFRMHLSRNVAGSQERAGYEVIDFVQYLPADVGPGPALNATITALQEDGDGGLWVQARFDGYLELSKPMFQLDLFGRDLCTVLVRWFEDIPEDRDQNFMDAAGGGIFAAMVTQRRGNLISLRTCVLNNRKKNAEQGPVEYVHDLFPRFADDVPLKAIITDLEVMDRKIVVHAELPERPDMNELTAYEITLLGRRSKRVAISYFEKTHGELDKYPMTGAIKGIFAALVEHHRAELDGLRRNLLKNPKNRGGSE